jgi:hypothetical protein
MGTIVLRGFVGSGDCESEEDAVEEFFGGPRAQADWGGILGTEAETDIFEADC